MDVLADTAFHKVDELTSMAWELRRQDPHKTLELAERALKHSHQLNYPSGTAYSLVAKAFAQFRLSKLDEARHCAEEAKSLFERLEDKQGLVRTHNILGIVYGESGNLLAALRAFLDTDTLCKEILDHHGEANALNNIANVYAFLGDYVSALDYHFQSLAVCREHPYPAAETGALLNLGLAYYELGQYREALEYLFKALSLEAKNETHTHAVASLNIGRSYQKLGQLDKAREYLQQSLDLNVTTQDNSGLSYVFDSLGTLELAEKNWSEANLYLHKSLELKRDIGDKRGQSETLVLLGQVFEAQGDLETAEAQLKNALAITEKVGNKVETYQAYQHLSEVYKQQENYQAALEVYQLYSRLREDILNESQSQHLQSLRLRFEVSASAREKEIFRLKNVELAEKNVKLNKLNEALQKANAEKSQLVAELERQAKEDALTGLYNRRYFDEIISRAFAQAQRVNTPLSVAISDIDNFKLINDRFSHQMGDLVLRTVAKLMKETMRDIDTVARYGGEEFVILLPSANAEGAEVVCERIRHAVESYDWRTLHHDLKVTLSIGISDDLAVANYERLMALADDNLYKAKHNGKNQVRS